MIKINRIKEVNDITKALKARKYLVFIAEPIDDRTRFLDKTIRENLSKDYIVNVSIDFATYSLRINKDIVLIKNLVSYLNKLIKTRDFDEILLEMTSIDFSELLYLIFAIDNLDIIYPVTAIYSEPDSYSKKNSTVDESIDFLLSDSHKNFVSLPPFSIHSTEQDKTNLVAVLGFENNRLGQALGEDDDGVSYESLQAMIGIPAFKPGWENNSLDIHLNYFKNINTCLSPYPATNPYQLNRDLEELLNAYNKLVIVSMGTKPAALAICIFLVNNVPKNTRTKRVGTIYDFPKKKLNRSIGIGKTYMYNLAIKNNKQ
jgi:hypothetical protein